MLKWRGKLNFAQGQQTNKNTIIPDKFSRCQGSFATVFEPEKAMIKSNLDIRTKYQTPG